MLSINNIYSMLLILQNLWNTEARNCCGHPKPKCHMEQHKLLNDKNFYISKVCLSVWCANTRLLQAISYRVSANHIVHLKIVLVFLPQEHLAIKKEISELVVEKNCARNVRIEAAFTFSTVYTFSLAANKREKIENDGRSAPPLFYHWIWASSYILWLQTKRILLSCINILHCLF